jgi:hypothetical protein
LIPTPPQGGVFVSGTRDTWSGARQNPRLCVKICDRALKFFDRPQNTRELRAEGSGTMPQRTRYPSGLHGDRLSSRP